MDKKKRSKELQELIDAFFEIAPFVPEFVWNEKLEKILKKYE